MFSPIARAMTACLMFAVATSTFAAATPPLTLREAIEHALASNPDLRTFEYDLRAQDARIAAAQLRPAPELSIEVENVLGSGALRGTDAAESTLALSQVVELGGKRSARVAGAESGRELQIVRRQAAQLDVLAEVVRRFVKVAASQREVSVNRQGTELSRRTVEAVRKRVQAAKSPEVELHRVQVELMRAEIATRHAEHELLAARMKLAAMWGDSAPDFERVEADLFKVHEPPPFQQLADRLQRNPDFTRFASEARLRDVEIRLAQSRRRPDVELSLGVRRLEETRDTAVVAGLSLPLLTGSQARPAIAEAQAARDRLDAEREAAAVKVRAVLFELYQELAHSVAEVGILTRDVGPQMEEALRETQYAFDRGRYSLLELVDGQRAYLDVQRGLINAAANAHTLQAEIERLTGEPLAAGSNQREMP